MAVAAPSPVKILSDLGYEIWEIENDADLRSALIEAINTLSMTNSSDPRIPVLQDAVRNIQRSRFKTKKVSAAKLLNRQVRSPQKLSPQKLLPGTAEKGSSPLAMRLGNIVGALGNLGNVLAQQLSFDKRNLAQDKKSNIEESKDQREEELEEEKKKTSKPGSSKIASAIAAPFEGLFGTIKKFVGNIVAGSAVLGLMKWLKSFDKSQWDGFIKALQEKAPLILAGILALAALPLVSTLAGFTGVLLGGLAILGPIIPLLLKGMVAAASIAAAIIAGKWVWDKGKKAVQGAAGFMHSTFAGGDASAAGDVVNTAELRKSGVSQNWLDRRLGMYTVHTRKINPHTGKMTNFVSSKGYDELSKEQKAAVDKFNAESKRMNDLEKERDQKIKELRKSLWEGPEGGTWKYTEGFARLPWNKMLTEEGKEKEKEIDKKVRAIYKNYEGRISSGPSLNDLMQNKSISPFRIDQPLNGEGSVNFMDLGNIGGEEQGSTSGTEGGSTSPIFSSKSNDRVSNAFVVGAFA